MIKNVDQFRKAVKRKTTRYIPTTTKDGKPTFRKTTVEAEPKAEPKPLPIHVRLNRPAKSHDTNVYLPPGQPWLCAG
jgi:hypothetical protein